MATTVAPPTVTAPDLTPEQFVSYLATLEPSPADCALARRLLAAPTLEACELILAASRCACDRNSPCRYPLCSAGE